MMRLSQFLKTACLPGVAVGYFLVAGCSSKKEEPGEVLKTDAELHELFPVSHRPEQLAWADPMVCAECHESAHEDWLKSHHAIANRLIIPDKDAEAFSVPSITDEAGVEYQLTAENGEFSIVEKDPPAAMPEGHDSPVIGVIGETPLWQYLVPTTKGRLQTQAMTWDPHNKEWFNVFGDEKRRPTEWGHWTQQGMNWNTNCAWCHMTHYDKNYDIQDDSYKSTWLLQTVSCVQCHDGMKEHVEAARRDDYVAPATKPDLQISMENCATCHARREELTPHDFVAGDRFFDHYRLTLPDTPGAYFADGQALEEDYVFASFMMSRMGHKNVTCMDCHNPHSGEPILPVENNALCMRCHASGANESIQIDPIAHSRHPIGSTGNQCVTCHMPERTYMERDPRKDHGFTSPDPQLTIDFGVPNACNQCHTDQTPEWALKYVNEWYGESDRRKHVHARARALTAAHAGEEGSLEQVKELFASEDNVYWKTVWMRLMAMDPQDEQVFAHAETALEDESPLLREAGLTVMTQRQDQLSTVQAALNDDSRLVRNRAAEALLPQFDPAVEAFREWQAYAEMNADRPGGALRRAELAVNQQDFQLARKLTLRAVTFDKENPYLYYDAAIMLSRIGDINGALSLLSKARTFDDSIGLLAYSQGLLYAEKGDYVRAEKAFVEAVGLDPDQARWWYNLAMIYAYNGDATKAMGCISRAIELEPGNPEFLMYQQQLGARMQGDAGP